MGGTLVANESKATLPAAFSLEGNFPKPFNPLTTIRYSLPQPTQVELTIYDLGGSEVARLVDGTMARGDHQVH